MASTRQSPPSPTKSKSTFSISNLLTGINPNNNDASRFNNKSQQKPLSSNKGVAHMVKAYETATLNSSSNKTLNSSSTLSSPTLVSPTKVPASLFQSQQTRRIPEVSSSSVTTSNLSSGKENTRLPLVLSTSTNRHPEAVSKPTNVTASKEVTPVVLTDDRAIDVRRNAGTESTRVGDRRSRIGGEPLVINVSPRTTTASPNRGPAITPKSPARASRFREELPRTAPRTNTYIEVSPYTSTSTSSTPNSREPPLIPIPIETNESQKVGGGRRRASTVGSVLKSPVPTIVDGYEEVKLETEFEKTIRIESEFEALLDTMQLPSKTVRDRMLTLTTALKMEMLRSSSPATTPRIRTYSQSNDQSFTPTATSTKSKSNNNKSTNSKSRLSGLIRKTKSSTSLAPSPKYSDSPTPTSNSSIESSNRKPSRPTHGRSLSATQLIFKTLGRSTTPTPSNIASSASSIIGAGEGKEEPSWWAIRLRSTQCGYHARKGKVGTDLSVVELGRLRARLRAEPIWWIEEFLEYGGYQGLLERLKELLDLEWREEQHDDQTLHELLRCFQALSLTNSGKKALASRSPIPFTSLTSLLFSEKKPGDLAPRQILVEIILSLLEIYPEGARLVEKVDWSVSILDTSRIANESGKNDSLESGKNQGGGGRRYTRKIKDEEGEREAEEEIEISQERKRGTHEFVKSLMMGPPDEKEESKVEFMKDTHKARIYKTWIKELGDTVRDYFWVFCHSQNMLWSMEMINPDMIEAPKVPTGMTGGVEHDAMLYCASHFRLINAVARTCPTKELALEFHIALFESGIERIILTLRRASQDFYGILHLELARYIDLARSAQVNLGPKIFGMIDARLLSSSERQVLVDYAQRKHVVPKGTPQLAAFNF